MSVARAAHRPRCIGTGARGSVYLGYNRVTGELVAVKEIHASDKWEYANILNEIRVMQAVTHHPRLVKYLGVRRGEGHHTGGGLTVEIIMEYVAGGSLGSLLRRFGVMGETVCQSYIRDVLEGLAYLHDVRRICHRDVKPENIFVTPEGRCKLGDFGSSKCYTAASDVRGSGHPMFDTCTGTPWYMAPEVICCSYNNNNNTNNNSNSSASSEGEAGSITPGAGANDAAGDTHSTPKGYGFPADIWSLGCTLYEMLVGEPPHADCANAMAVLYRVASLASNDCEMPFDLPEHIPVRVYGAGGYSYKDSPSVTIHSDSCSPHEGDDSSTVACGSATSNVLWGDHTSSDVCSKGPPLVLSDNGRGFMRLCLSVDPTARPCAAELLRHPWLARTDNIARSGEVSSEGQADVIVEEYNTDNIIIQQPRVKVSRDAPVPHPQSMQSIHIVPTHIALSDASLTHISLTTGSGTPSPCDTAAQEERNYMSQSISLMCQRCGASPAVYPGTQCHVCAPSRQAVHAPHRQAVVPSLLHVTWPMRDTASVQEGDHQVRGDISQSYSGITLESGEHVDMGIGAFTVLPIPFSGSGRRDTAHGIGGLFNPLEYDCLGDTEGWKCSMCGHCNDSIHGSCTCCGQLQ